MSNRTIAVTDARTPLQIFFDIELDDAELDPYQFRIYSRIVRRAAGGQSECFESLESMANGCKMSRKTAVYAIKELIRRKMVRRISRTGETSIYAVLDKSHWLPGNLGNHPDLVTDGTTTQGVTVPPTGNSGNHHLVTDGTTKKIQKKTPKKTQEEHLPASPKQPDLLYAIFTAAFLNKGGMPYLSKAADFVQLTGLKKKCQSNNWELTPERFSKATANYFQSELGSYTLAHLAANFSTFFNSALDRFGKPQQKGTYAKTGNDTPTDHAAIVATFKPANRIGG